VRPLRQKVHVAPSAGAAVDGARVVHASLPPLWEAVRRDREHLIRVAVAIIVDAVASLVDPGPDAWCGVTDRRFLVPIAVFILGRIAIGSAPLGHTVPAPFERAGMNVSRGVVTVSPTRSSVDVTVLVAIHEVAWQVRARAVLVDPVAAHLRSVRKHPRIAVVAVARLPVHDKRTIGNLIEIEVVFDARGVLVHRPVAVVVDTVAILRDLDAG
jgi:hypothetical protein